MDSHTAFRALATPTSPRAEAENREDVVADPGGNEHEVLRSLAPATTSLNPSVPSTCRSDMVLGWAGRGWRSSLPRPGGPKDPLRASGAAAGEPQPFSSAAAAEAYHWRMGSTGQRLPIHQVERIPAGRLNAYLGP
jgi:hypothetical protein